MTRTFAPAIGTEGGAAGGGLSIRGAKSVSKQSGWKNFTSSDGADGDLPRFDVALEAAREQSNNQQQPHTLDTQKNEAKDESTAANAPKSEPTQVGKKPRERKKKIDSQDEAAPESDEPQAHDDADVAPVTTEASASEAKPEPKTADAKKENIAVTEEPLVVAQCEPNAIVMVPSKHVEQLPVIETKTKPPAQEQRNEPGAPQVSAETKAVGQEEQVKPGLGHKQQHIAQKVPPKGAVAPDDQMRKSANAVELPKADPENDAPQASTPQPAVAAAGVESLSTNQTTKPAADAEIRLPTDVKEQAITSSLPQQVSTQAIVETDEQLSGRAIERETSVEGDGKTAAGKNTSLIQNLTVEHQKEAGDSAKVAAKAQESPRAEPPETFDQIVLGLRGKLDAKTGKAEIRLDPPNLGVVRVSVALDNGVLTAEFHSASDVVRDLLKSNLDKLKTILEGQGVAVDKLAVDSSAERPTSQPSGQQGSFGSAAHDGRSAGQYQPDSRNGQRRAETQTFARAFREALDAPLDLVA